MSAYPGSIGEPENSQDTPFPNTTPIQKRRVYPDPRPGPAKKVKPLKLNQCQKLFKVMTTSRSMEDKFDPNFDATDTDLVDMDKVLDNEEASVLEAKEDNDELLLLIQELEAKSRAAKQSNEHLGGEATGSGITSDSQRSKPTDIDMPDYLEHRDGRAVLGYTQAHKERLDALQGTLDNIERVKEQVAGFKGDLSQARAEFPAQVEQVRLEYKARLDQQRTELEQKPRERTARYQEELTAMSRPNQTELSDARQVGEAAADKKMEELQLRMHKKKQKLRKARHAVISSKRELEYQKVRHGQDLRFHERAYEKLEADREDDQRGCQEVENKLRKELTLIEGDKRSYGKACIEYMARIFDLEKKFRVSKSTLQGTVLVAAMQMMQLDVARREKALLLRCLANAKSDIAELESEFSDLTATLNLRESRLEDLEGRSIKTDRHLDTKRVLIDGYTLQIKELQAANMELESKSLTKDVSLGKQSATISTQYDRICRLMTESARLGKALNDERKQSALLQGQSSDASQRIQELTAVKNELIKQVSDNDRKLMSHAARLKEHQTQINDLVNAKTELSAQMKHQNHILSSRATKISDHEQRIEDLKGKGSEIAKELAAQRTLVTCNAQRIRVLEGANNELDATITRLDSILRFKNSTLDTNVSTIASQKEHIRGIEGTVQSLLDDKAKTGIAMIELERDFDKLKLRLDTEGKELTSQITLVAQRDGTIRGLEATNHSFSQAQVKATSDSDNLKTQLSKLTLDVRSKDEELNSHKSIAATKDRTIQILEATNADLLRAQEVANNDKVNLQATVKIASGKSDELRTTLQTREGELRVATEETEHVRRRLEEVEKDLLAEKSANRTASLEILLQNANDTTKALSKELIGKKERLEEEESTVKSLSKDLNGKTERLEEEKSTVKALSKELDGKTERLEEEKTTVKSLSKDLNGKIERLEEKESTVKALSKELDSKTERLEEEKTTVKSLTKDLNGKIERLEEEKITAKALSEDLDDIIERLEEEKSTVKTLSKNLDDKTERLKKEKTTNASLHADIGRLEKEQLMSSEEKKNSEKKNKELMERLSLDQATIQNLRTEAASNSTLLCQLQKRRIRSDAERTCLLHQLMTESTRVHCVADELPKDLAGLIGDRQDVRMFLGKCAGETVLVRAQRFREERKAFIIAEKCDHTRIVWHESLDMCTIQVLVWDRYLRLDNGPNEAPFELRIDEIAGHDLKEWLKGPDTEIANGFGA